VVGIGSSPAETSGTPPSEPGNMTREETQTGGRKGHLQDVAPSVLQHDEKYSNTMNKN
jgi:hypothetical protein